MDIPITPATNVKCENEEGTQFSATVNGTHHSGICEGGSEWPNVQKAIEDGADVEEYVPHVDTPTELLAQSDMIFIKSCARMLEDIADEREANGDYINDKVKASKAERKALRE